jgi:hypothetical protein
MHPHVPISLIMGLSGGHMGAGWDGTTASCVGSRQGREAFMDQVNAAAS